jgi:outer membrane receptor protein involved in Fe transport
MTTTKPLCRDRSARCMRSGVRRALCVALAAAFTAPAHAAADLTSLSLEQLLEVTVVGASKYEQKQSEVAAAVSVITRSEIQAFGWRTLAEALASLPGIHTTYDRQYAYLGTRGFGLPGDLTSRVLITINGNRVNDPVYDGGPAGREVPIDMDLIERIEFIPGPGGAVYGQNAMFGVVNVITRNGADVDGAELTAAAQGPQSLREWRASWGKRLDNGVDVVLSASGLRSRGEDRFFDYGSTGLSGVAAGLDAERDREFYARIARGAWAFDAVYGNRGKKDPTAAFFNDPLVPGYFAKDSYGLAQLQYQDSFAGDTLQVSGRLFAGRYRYDGTYTYGGSLVSFPAEGDWRGTEWRLLSTAVAGHKLMLGIEAQDNVRTDQSVNDLADPANSFKIARSGYRVGIYAQDEWRLGETLTATLGYRVDRNNKTGTKASPRAALIWQAAPATTLKALAGRAHRAPNAYESQYDDVFSQVSNPALMGEHIDTLELVADHRIGSDLALRASVYEWTMHDIVTLGIDPVSGLTQYQSGEKVKARGLELSADKTWASGARLRGSVAAQDVAYASGGALLNSPKLLGKLNLSGPLPWAGLRAGYEWRYDSRRLTLDGSKLGGYAVSNLHLSTEALAKGLELSLSIQNLFDKHYAQPGADTNWQNALEQDGRSVRVAASYRF